MTAGREPFANHTDNLGFHSGQFGGKNNVIAASV